MLRVHVPDRVFGDTRLTPSERRDVRALAEALFTTSSGPPPEARLDWLVDDVDDFVAQAGLRALMSFRVCLRAVASLTPALALRPHRRFADLKLERRIRGLERFEATPAGLAVFGARAILCFSYYEHPDVARAVAAGEEPR